jgi:hypothetical protein
MANEYIPHASRDHLKMVVDQYDVTRQPGPVSRFSYDFSSIGIWCLPHNHPGGLWDSFDFARGPHGPYNPSRAEDVGIAYPLLDADGRTIIEFTIQTRAYALRNQDLIPDDAMKNRPEDLRWTVEQLAWLWEQAFPGTPLPPISVTDWQADPSDLEDFADWVVANAARKPGEPLSNLPPAKNPRPF